MFALFAQERRGEENRGEKERQGEGLGLGFLLASPTEHRGVYRFNCGNRAVISLEELEGKA